MSISVLPQAIDALLVALRAQQVPAGVLEGVQIIDGPPTNDFELPLRALLIGASEDPDDVLAASNSQTEVGLGRKTDETFDIHCNAVVWTGGAQADLSAARTAVYGLLDAVATVLAENRTLSGTVNRAALTGDRQYGQRRTADGVGAVIAFDVQCTSRP